VIVGVNVLVGVGVAVLVLVGVVVGVFVGVGLGNSVATGGQPQLSEIIIEPAVSGKTTTKLPEETCENVRFEASEYGVVGP